MCSQQTIFHFHDKRQCLSSPSKRKVPWPDFVRDALFRPLMKPKISFHFSLQTRNRREQHKSGENSTKRKLKRAAISETSTSLRGFWPPDDSWWRQKSRPLQSRVWAFGDKVSCSSSCARGSTKMCVQVHGFLQHTRTAVCAYFGRIAR